MHKNTENFMSTPGFGVQGTVGSKSIALGNEAFLEKQDVPNDELNDFRKAANPFKTEKTVAGIVINSHVAGLLAVSDPSKRCWGSDQAATAFRVKSHNVNGRSS